MTKKVPSISSPAAIGTSPEGSGLHRREFITRLSAGTALAGLALASGAAPARADDTPKKGGHLIVGTDGASSTDSLDPQTYLGAFLPLVGMSLYDTLTDLDEKGHFIPHLAESWDVSPDAKKWVFKLRNGVTFHNEKTMTAGDVAYSLNLHRSKDSKSAAKAYLTSITDITATGPLEITILLSGGDADIPYILTDYHLCIMPEGAKPTRPSEPDPMSTRSSSRAFGCPCGATPITGSPTPPMWTPPRSWASAIPSHGRARCSPAPSI